MANICDFEMMIEGETENINAFLNALNQNGDYVIGRGAWIDCREDYEDVCCIAGGCKWSIFSALYTDAHSMARQKETGEGFWYNQDGFIDNHEFIDFIEASGKWNLKIEIVSWECGMEFSEHYIVKNGVMEVQAECTYSETYNEDTDDYEIKGGFEHLF